MVSIILSIDYKSSAPRELAMNLLTKLLHSLMMLITIINIISLNSSSNNKNPFTRIEATQINSNPPYSQANLAEFKLSSQNQISQAQATFESTTSVNTSNNGSLIESMPNFYSSSQASKFRVNVSNICEKNHMHVTIRLNRPFYGLIHTKDRRKKVPCFVEGTGEQAYTMDISYTLIQSDLSYCGVVSHHLSGSIINSQQSQTVLSKQEQQASNQQTTLSVVLVVRLHKTIEFSDDRYFLLSCANRCSKADCTQENNHNFNGNNPSPSSNRTSSYNTNINENENKNFSNHLLASETIVSPILKSIKAPSEDKMDGLVKNNNRLALELSEPIINSEKCELMLSLKFNWLVKVCFILALLLALVFCFALYLCLTLNKRRDRQKMFNKSSKMINNNNNNQHHSSNKSKLSNKISKSNIKKVAASSYAQGENLSWPTASASLCATNNKNEDELNKIREDNSFLAQQNQQLLLAGSLLVNSNNNNIKNLLHSTTTSANEQGTNVRQIDYNNNNTSNPTQSHHSYYHQQHHQDADNKPAYNELIVGRRSIEPLNFGGTQRVRSLATQVNNNSNDGQRDSNTICCIKRRRSIGSSVAPMPLSYDNNVDHDDRLYSRNLQQQANKTIVDAAENKEKFKFDLHNRNKSRSQTTIYYEQNRDPFKTVPFNFINTGYLSDGQVTREICLNNSNNSNNNNNNNPNDDDDDEDDNVNNNNFIDLRMAQHENQMTGRPITNERNKTMLNQNYLIYPQQLEQKLDDELMSHSLPPENNRFEQANNNYAYNNNNINNQYRHQHHHNQNPVKRWIPAKNSQGEQLNINMASSRQQKQRLVNSQFDPHENSHQLIDLIQQKHKQQIEQANRTAASLAPSFNEQLFHQQVAESANRQMQAHHNNDVHYQYKAAWK